MFFRGNALFLTKGQERWEKRGGRKEKTAEEVFSSLK